MSKTTHPVTMSDKILATCPACGPRPVYVMAHDGESIMACSNCSYFFEQKPTGETSAEQHLAQQKAARR